MEKRYERSGKILKEIREDLGLTQREMGNVLGMHTQFVSNTERGLSFVPPKAFNVIINKMSERNKKLLDQLEKAIKADLYQGFISGKLEGRNAKKFN